MTAENARHQNAQNERSVLELQRLRERRARGDVRQHASHRQRAMQSFALGECGLPTRSSIPTRGTRAARCRRSTTASPSARRTIPTSHGTSCRHRPSSLERRATILSCRRHIGERSRVVILGVIVAEHVQTRGRRAARAPRARGSCLAQRVRARRRPGRCRCRRRPDLVGVARVKPNEITSVGPR